MNSADLYFQYKLNQFYPCPCEALLVAYFKFSSKESRRKTCAKTAFRIRISANDSPDIWL